MGKNYLSNEKMLQNYGVLFQNLNKETELSAELAEYGYDAARIAKGKELYDKAVESYQKSKKESTEETTASMSFRKKLDEITQLYLSDRKKVKLIFKDQPDVLKNLSLKGAVSQVNANFLQEMKDLYQSLDENQVLQEAVKVFKITPEYIKSQLDKIKQIELAYGDYLQEKGESQQATKDKNKAFAELDKWVKELYGFAKLALEDRPQLLESIAKIVK